ncbi:FadR family transcriptional regulator [Ancylobacter sp. A5.8]|uniref:FadR/GntR family transcriptional regulator n=1 Tax=Ancylobacter gelatini TaxID=2919920 RepID=UPI001F4D9D1A|nr:FadR/GntR family transcriptional regulator [Ancylobacter gelatini]MCJ8145247.1 FadR family transcriptional regulator [Ancylobacter gelatini]
MSKNEAVAISASGERGPVPRNVVEHLQGLILQGSLKSGERLPSQRDLAEQLGVSRPSLREALTVLETRGLVTVRAGSGVFVSRPAERGPLWRYADRCTPRDVYEARLGLEAYAARLAAPRTGPAEAARLDEFVARMDEAYRRDDLTGMSLTDAGFHDFIFELSGNPMLAAMYRPIRDMAEESQRLPMAWRERLGETPREHRHIAERLTAQDSAGAEAAMQQHIRAAAARYGIVL